MPQADSTQRVKLFFSLFSFLPNFPSLFLEDTGGLQPPGRIAEVCLAKRAQEPWCSPKSTRPGSREAPVLLKASSNHGEKDKP